MKNSPADEMLMRLLRAAEAGGHGVDLSKMSDAEIVRRLRAKGEGWGGGREGARD